MQPGCFYCFVPKKGTVTSWLPFCKNSHRSIVRRINALLKTYCQSQALSLYNRRRDTDGERTVLDDTELFQGVLKDSRTNRLTLIFPGAGVTVRSGKLKPNCHINRKEPIVYYTEKAFIVLNGYVSNIDDLCLHMGQWSLFESDTHDLTIGDISARVILHLYMGEKAKDPLLVLSELQGHYAFVIYDNEEKSLFAARDTSGKQQLYYAVDPETGISLSNVPPLELQETWMEIPPGHYLHGRHPQLLQFALTADQLTVRWSLDLDSETELYSSLDSDHECRRPWSLGFVESFRNRITTHPHDISQSL